MRIEDELGYIEVLRTLVTKAETTPKRDDRTGVGTSSVFGVQLKFDLSGDVIPLMRSKFVAYKAVMAELVWFLLGSTNNLVLNQLGATIWDEWADYDGNLGPIYGAMWRDWGLEGQIDQIYNLVRGLKNQPFSRRHIVTGWDPKLLPEEGVSHADNISNGKQVLPPCHVLQQYYVEELEDGTKVLHSQLYQRSADWFIGTPFNIASYGALLILVAKATGMKTGTFTYTVGDAHLYSNHVSQAKQQLRNSLSLVPGVAAKLEYKDDTLVNLISTPIGDITDDEWIRIIKDFDTLYVVSKYNHMGRLKAPIAV